MKRIIKVLDELRPKLPMLGTVLAGWVLVLFAKEMSKSMALRVTGGGLVVGLMMGTIVLCWLRYVRNQSSCLRMMHVWWNPSTDAC